MVIRYKDFEAQARQMHDELVSAVTAEADAWLQTTLSMLRRMPGLPTEQGVSPDERNARAITNRPGGRNGATLSEVTKKAIDSMNGKEFDTPELRKVIEVSGRPMENATQKANLANLLRQMVNRGEIKLIKHGKGAKPSRFRKEVTPAQPTDEKQG